MAEIPCEDFFEGLPGTIPIRPKRTNPDSIKDRWANFVYSMDLSPEPGDEQLGNVNGAWSLWDLETSFAAQVDDERGDDQIVVAIIDRAYILDWTRYRDEYAWETFAPTYRMMRFGPIPYSPDETEAGLAAFRMDALKRFREFSFNVKDRPRQLYSKYRFHVAEWDNEQQTERIGTRIARLRNRFLAAVRGQSFVVTVEHAANEQLRLEHWQAKWDVLGKRIQPNRKTL